MKGTSDPSPLQSPVFETLLTVWICAPDNASTPSNFLSVLFFVASRNWEYLIGRCSFTTMAVIFHGMGTMEQESSSLLVQGGSLIESFLLPFDFLRTVLGNCTTSYHTVGKI